MYSYNPGARGRVGLSMCVCSQLPAMPTALWQQRQSSIRWTDRGVKQCPCVPWREQRTAEYSRQGWWTVLTAPTSQWNATSATHDDLLKLSATQQSHHKQSFTITISKLTGCAFPSTSPSNWPSWHTEPFTAPHLHICSHVSLVLPTWCRDN